MDHDESLYGDDALVHESQHEQFPNWVDDKVYDELLHDDGVLLE